MDQAKIGKFIGTMRKLQGMTQEQLGEKLGVTNKTVSRWETGKYMPDIDKLQELSALLGVSVNELLAGERIENTDDLIKKADENLISVLSKDSAFGLQDRIDWFKRKWLKDHKALIAAGMIILVVLCVLGICTGQPIVLAMLPLVGLIAYARIRNRMMIYVEQHAYITAGESAGDADSE